MTSAAMPPSAGRRPLRPAWIIAGPTATGKSAVAQRIAESTGAAIISADSMLVYRGMDIGTAKPTPAERGSVPYLGIDLATPDAPFSTGAWLEAVHRQLDALPSPGSEDASRPGRGLIVAGGTGLYLQALSEGLDAPPAVGGSRETWRAVLEEGGIPALRAALLARSPGTFRSLNASDQANPRRLLRALEKLDADEAARDGGNGTALGLPPAIRPCGIVTLAVSPDILGARIERRVRRMFADGLLEETARLRAAYPAWSPTAEAAIGYAEATAVLAGEFSMEEAVARIAARTRRLAKRQRTWFRHRLSSVAVDASSGDVAKIAEAVCSGWSVDPMG